ncbi:MAG: hypothetical protein DA330_10885 [Nitrososphaera sp.]|nr:hypothetical protein [Nitrososphaera sp.]
MADNFWENMDQYRKFGFDPLKWISGCSNEVDESLVRAALSEVKHTSIKIAPSWHDSFFYMDGKEPELTRRVYDFANPEVSGEFEAKRAVTMFRVHSSIAESASGLAASLQKFLGSFKNKVAVANAKFALTEHQDAQFALLDYIHLHRGDKAGYMPAVTSCTPITDITTAPDDEIHVKIALTAAIEALNLLGCGNPSTFKFFPIYDAPTDSMLDKIRTNLDAFMSHYNLVMEDYSSLKRGRLFYGTTAMAITNKELPTKYDQVEEGMEILLTNKFGGLAAASMHALALMDSANADKFEQAGVSMQSIATARDEAIKNLSTPHFALGKVIAKFCPDFGSAFDKNAHIAAVYPAGPRGLFALGSLAELANSSLVINDLPLRHEEISRLATKEFLVENSTASIHGCHVIIGTKEVLGSIAAELSQHHFAPEKIGFVAKKGTTSVILQKDASQFISSKAKLARLAEVSAPKPAG